MSDKKGRLASLWTTEDSKRTNILERARTCAALTKPWVLPPLGQTEDAKLPENYQSVGSRGITNLVGKMLLALFPPDTPWFRLELAPEILYDPRIDPKAVERVKQILFLQELLIQATIESAGVKGKKRPNRRCGFRTAKLTSLTQLMVTGDTLERLMDDYRLRVFRRDQYVTCRDSCGDVLYHVIKESIDPLSLSDAHFEKSKLDRDVVEKKSVRERMIDLYTAPEWQPQTKQWKISQEVNGHEINVSEETISPFFSTAMELSPGENYGRGFIELNLGDLSSMDELEKRLLQFADLASKFHPAIDDASNVKDEDLARPSGSVLRGARVVGGQIQDIAFLKIDKYPDFKVVYDTAEKKRKDLGGAMLIESDVTPRGERVTRYQASRIAQELEGTLGGFYAPIADEQQQPLLERCIYQLKRDNAMPLMPDDTYRTVSLTGLAALSREIKADKILEVATVATQLGPNGLAKVEPGVLIDVLARYRGVHEPGLIKSNEQVAAEQQQAIALATQQAAAEKAIDVTGNVAETTLTQGQ